VLALLFAATTARANPEPPATYDARVAGMAGVGVASVDGPAALFHNPAQLDQIERFAATAVVTSLLVNLQAPFAGPGSEQESGIIYAPLGFLGGVGRIHERLTIGLGAYVYTGFGGGFPSVDCITYGDPSACDDPSYRGRFDPPRFEEVTLFVAELAVPFQVSIIPEKLSLGISLRLPWARQVVRATQEFSGVFTQAEQNVNGFGIPGVLIGLTARPVEGLTIAAAYRSKVRIGMDGETTVPNPLNPDGDPFVLATTTTWYVPHMIRAGVAYRFFNERITIAAEFRAQLHAEANGRQQFDLTSDDPIIGSLVPDTDARFDWKNVYLGGLGFEFYATRRFPLRIGGTVANSASNEATLTPFSPPPGIQFSLLGGFGVRAGPIDVDFAFGWGGAPTYRVDENHPLCSPAADRTEGNTLTASGGCAGDYDVDSWFLSLSATYRLGRTDAMVRGEVPSP